MGLGRVYASLSMIAVGLALAGCGDSGRGPADSAPAPGEPAAAVGQPEVKMIQPGAPGEPSRELDAAPAQDIKHTAADVEFMQGMIHHHQQAVIMSEWVRDRTQSTSVRLFARRIEVSQEDEINLMRNWLKKRGVDPNDHSHRHRAMPGMVNSRQLARLKGSEGKRFDRLFLRYMSRHHQGAIQMVQELVDKGGGAETEIGQFILHVDADQRIEIARAQEMLAKL